MMPPDANRMQDDHAPTPFSAADIAAACGPGRVTTYRVSRQDGPTVLLRWEFTSADDEGAESVSETFDTEGRSLGPAETSTARWVDLQRHASTPADLTTVEADEVEVPAGRFRCWRYTVQGDGGHSVSWFAVGLPGPPVRRIEVRDGVEVSEMTLVAVEDPRTG